MAILEISDELADRIKEATEKALRDEVLRQATEFTDISDLSDPYPRLMHRLSGRILTVKAEWDDGHG